jgi:molybdopterin molybdotransferase
MPDANKMISLEEALTIADRRIEKTQLPTKILPVRVAIGHVVAEDQRSVLDNPPFDKSAMDGYAIPEGEDCGPFRVLETVAAGDVPSQKLTSGTAIKVMTGAPVPEGTAKVVMIEKTRQSDGYVEIMESDSSRHICRKGEDIRCGDVVLRAGAVLGPLEIGNLISVGISQVQVTRPVRIGIISTGNEIVDCPDELAAGKIMNSNGPMLAALCQKYHIEVVGEQIVSDQLDSTIAVLKETMNKADIVVLSGGVSVGQFDYVAEAMKQTGLAIHFDRVCIKPGKPMTFACSDEHVVFGLPGNPVAVYLMFHLFVLRAARMLSGCKDDLRFTTLPLGFDFHRRKTERRGFLPCRLDRNGTLQEVDYHGTAHLQALLSSDGFFVVPVGQTHIPAGEKVDFLCLKGAFQ